jgi:thiol-disulfide isomerase/thioredoxin
MFMKKALFVSVILALVVAAWAQDNTMMKSDKPAPADGSMMKADSSMKKTDTMMVSDADKKMAADPMDASAYNLKGLGKQVSAWTTIADAMANAKKKDLTVVYFFAATWCPDCQATYQDLKANFAMLHMNFKLVFVNYDKSAELKKKYGITVQHTFLMVGPNGEKKKVWNGGNTVAELIKNSSTM